MADIIDRLLNGSHHVVGKLAVLSRRLKEPANDAALLLRLDEYLAQLSEIDMRPEINEKARISSALRTICGVREDCWFHQRHVQLAHDLLQRFDNERWGAAMTLAPDPPDMHQQQDTLPTSPNRCKPYRRRRKSSVSVGNIHSPPAGHHIWGVHGIMHGIAVHKHDGKKNNLLDPRYEHRKRDARNYGHNGLTVGQWFPIQLVALFNGAHGSAQGGIHGDKANGAFSILVGGKYDLLDTDNGNTLFYSGTGSCDNRDPDNPVPSTQGTLALHASMRTRTPVRVMRAAGSSSSFAPSLGLRYDGLYIVEEVILSENTKGGKYEKFKLVREPNQRHLNELVTIPSIRQQNDYARIKDYFKM